MKHIFIVNLVSGQGGKGQAICENIKRVCQEDGLEYEIRTTKGTGDAISIAKEYSDCENVIYGVGGDGTVNEVLNGIVGTRNMLGVIPSGSGNDFYRTLKSMDDGAHKVDVGVVNGMYFINIMCIGLDAEIADNVSLMKTKGVAVNRLYTASILYTFLRYKFKSSTIRFNDVEDSGEHSMLAICNAQYYGSGHRIAPVAELDDGLLDIYWASRVAKIRMPLLLLKIKNGKHQNSTVIHNAKTKEVDIISDKELISNVDGERLVDKHFHVEILEKAVTVYNNKSLIRRFLGEEKKGTADSNAKQKVMQ